MYGACKLTITLHKATNPDTDTKLNVTLAIFESGVIVSFVLEVMKLLCWGYSTCTRNMYMCTLNNFSYI